MWLLNNLVDGWMDGWMDGWIWMVGRFNERFVERFDVETQCIASLRIPHPSSHPAPVIASHTRHRIPHRFPFHPSHPFPDSSPSPFPFIKNFPILSPLPFFLFTFVNSQLFDKILAHCVLIDAILKKNLAE